MTWMSLKKFCDTNYPDTKFKNDSQRKAFVVKKGLTIQKDEDGRDGIAVAAEGDTDTKQIRVGKRLSASKIKRLQYEEDADKNEIQAQNLKNASNLKVNVNTKDSKCFFSGVLR